MSTSVGLEFESRVLGYLLTPGVYNENAGYLPRRGAIYCEVNTANQGTVEFDVPKLITSAKQAGEWAGWGSPAHIIARILFPVTGGGQIGGMPIYFIPQAEAAGATARVQTITPTTAGATGNGTHTVVINGRRGIDGDSYNVNIAEGDTEAQICTKITDVINNVLGAPVDAACSSPVDVVQCTNKWKGLTGQKVTIEIDTNGDDLGVAYVVAQSSAASGTPTVTDGLLALGGEWFTDILNSYSTNADVCDEFTVWNGRPSATNPSGRFVGTVMKPAVVYTGSTSDDDSAFTDARKNDCTIVICPAPLSDGLPMEAAANYMALYMRIAQDNPHLDVNGLFLPDMPMAATAFAMQDYGTRNTYLKKGCSTVDKVGNQYAIQDLVTTYHPEGEIPPQHRYVRVLTINYNIKYMYRLKEVKHVLDKVLAGDDDDLAVEGYIKPKMWKSTLNGFAVTLNRLGLITDVSFMQKSITAQVSSQDPNRFATFFRHKVTGLGRVLDTVVEQGFFFGEL